MLRSLAIGGLLAVQPTWAWGDLGHRTVGYLAQMHFTNRTADIVQSILSLSATWDISDVAVWADSIRSDGHYNFSTPWHFIDAIDHPPTTCAINYKSDCSGKGCIVSAITNMTNILTTPSGDLNLDQEALKFLIHFLGDIHQPLHAEKVAWGGNGIPVCFDKICRKKDWQGRDKALNLHTVWDTVIPAQICGLNLSDDQPADNKPAARKWAAKLHGQPSDPSVRKSECTDISKGSECPNTWANQSNALVCTVVMPKGIDWFKDHDLAEVEYYLPASATVETMVRTAGTRLAAWLNALSAARSPRVEDEL